MIDEAFKLIPNPSEHSHNIFPPNMSQPTCSLEFPKHQEESNALLQNALATSCDPATFETIVEGWPHI
jgi:hypothetical protein